MTEPGEGRRAIQPEDAPARLWDLLDGFRTETEKMYSGEKGSADWEVARDAILVYVARRLHERTDTGEGAPSAWHDRWVSLITIVGEKILKGDDIDAEGVMDLCVEIEGANPVRHQPTDEGREGEDE